MSNVSHPAWAHKSLNDARHVYIKKRSGLAKLEQENCVPYVLAYRRDLCKFPHVIWKATIMRGGVLGHGTHGACTAFP